MEIPTVLAMLQTVGMGVQRQPLTTLQTVGVVERLVLVRSEGQVAQAVQAVVKAGIIQVLLATMAAVMEVLVQEEVLGKVLLQENLEKRTETFTLVAVAVEVGTMAKLAAMVGLAAERMQMPVPQITQAVVAGEELDMTGITAETAVQA